MNIKTLHLVTAVFLSSCSNVSLPIYQNKTIAKQNVQHTFGEWLINPRSCTISGYADDFTLSTTGEVANNVLEITTTFTKTLAQPPKSLLTELPVPIPMEGSRNRYTIVIAYDPTTVAHMLTPSTKLGVYYLPFGATGALQSSFSTRNLMFAMAELAKTCP